MVDWSARTKEIAAKFGLGDWFWRQIKQESNFNPLAYNAQSGATGIAQIVPKWHPKVNAKDPEASLQYAANWMRELIATYTRQGKQNATAWALAAYNWGPGNVDGWNGKRESLPKETRDYLDVTLGRDWTGGGSIVIPGLPTDRPSWWPTGWDWPPTAPGLPTLPTLPGWPQLPDLSTADRIAAVIWETIDGLRKRVRETILAKAQEMAAFWGGPVAFWVVGLAFVTFGLLGLALAGLGAVNRANVQRAKTLGQFAKLARGGAARNGAAAGAAAAGAVL